MIKFAGFRNFLFYGFRVLNMVFYVMRGFSYKNSSLKVENLCFMDFYLNFATKKIVFCQKKSHFIENLVVTLQYIK